MAGERTRDWASLRWKRLIAAALLAPLPALYIGFASFILAFSDRNTFAVLGLARDGAAWVWMISVLFTVIYLNIVPRLRGRIGMIECILIGALAAMSLALGYFGAITLDVIGPLPYMTFFPGVVLAFYKSFMLGGMILGATLAPAGALSGWIFWRIGVAPALPVSKVEVF